MFDAADPVHPVGAAAGIRDFGAAPFPGISIRPFIELALSVTCSVGSEVAEETPEAQTLCLVVSQSGEPADVLHAVESGAVAESPLLVLTNNAHSTLARRADAVVTSAAGPEIAAASTKTFVGSARDRRSTADPGPDTRAAFGRDIDKPRNLAKSVTVE